MMAGCHPLQVERAIAMTVNTETIRSAGMLQYLRISRYGSGIESASEDART